MNNSRLKKTTYSIVVLGLYEITLFVCNLILPRLIIGTYGSDKNGLISSITQFLSFASILRMGVAGATRAELYKPLADGDIEGISSIMNATQRYMRKIALIFIGYLLCVSIAFPFIVDSTYQWYEVLTLVLIMGVGTFSQYFFGLTYTTLLQADQRSYISNIFSIFAVLLNTGISCFLIVNNFSLHLVKIVYAIIFSITPFLMSMYVRKKYKLDKHAPINNNALKKRGDVMAHSIANIVHENTDIVVLTIFTNMVTVSVYSVYNLVMNGIKQLVSIFTFGLEGAFGNMLAKNQDDSFHNNFNLFEFLIGSFVSVVISCTGLLILPFVGLYTKGVTDVEYIIPVYAVIVVLAQAFYCIRIPYLTIVQASGMYKETRNGAFVEAFLNLSISIVLTIFFGIIGVAIGTLVANLFRTIQYAYFSYKNIIKKSIFYFWLRLAWVTLNCIMSVGICFLIKKSINFEFNNWYHWIIAGFLCASISILIWLVSSLIFYFENFKKSCSLFLRIFKKKSKKKVNADENFNS